MSRIYVVGAVNIDISGTPDTAFLAGDSNPGRVILSAGGVGRNIAENLRYLGHDVELVTLLGEDPYSDMIRGNCRQIGIGLSLARVIPGGHTSTYLCVNDESGNVAAAIADMKIYERMTPALLAPVTGELNKADLVVLDANLPETAIAFLCEQLTVPVFADPVSAKKAVRLRSSVGRLTAVKPNVPEAEVLTGITIRDDRDLAAAAEYLLSAGVRLVLISLGARGVYAADERHRGIYPCIDSPVINTNGCGDALLAAAVDAYLRGFDFETAVHRALSAAAVTAGYPGAACPTLRDQLL
ncbi:MAG: carbohydrate kinase family protein [Clostridia bacterium]|nr:carbohydrate kinase family protein [Clostridia bacterium]